MCASPVLLLLHGAIIMMQKILWYTSTKHASFDHLFARCQRNISRYSRLSRDILGNAQPLPTTHPHLLKKGQVMPGISKQEFAQRRNILINSIVSSDLLSDNDNMIVLVSNPLRYATGPVFYPYQQHTGLLYLTGCDEPDSVLIMDYDKAKMKYKSTLYCSPQNSDDLETALFSGASLGPKRAVESLGVDTAMSIHELPNSVRNSLYKRLSNTDALSDSSLKYKMIIDMHLDQQRAIKSTGEIALIREAARCIAAGFQHAMALTKPGIMESHIAAILEYHARISGAHEGLAYCPVVAQGHNALILHYVRNRHVLQDSNLVLVDAGAIVSHYRSDVSRTWPVSGKFTEPQRDLYQLVYHTQQSCIQRCRADGHTTLTHLYNHMIRELYNGLIHLGFKDISLDDVRSVYCPHDVGHHLGLDLHDCSTLPKDIPLKPGNVITIEPGIYIPPEDPHSPAAYHGIGIRIEDDVLITNGDVPDVLSDCIPSRIDLVEEACSKGVHK
jgi:Xaa-Pro aminopeptidase